MAQAKTSVEKHGLAWIDERATAALAGSAAILEERKAAAKTTEASEKTWWVDEIEYFIATLEWETWGPAKMRKLVAAVRLSARALTRVVEELDDHEPEVVEALQIAMKCRNRLRSGNVEEKP